MKILQLFCCRCASDGLLFGVAFFIVL